jgi:hypothetical protein
MLMSDECKVMLERGGIYHGYYYAVIAYSDGYRRGYVRVPPNHPCDGKKYEEPKVEVHGGLTFVDNTGHSLWKDCKFPDGGTMFGFDCHHYNDAEDPSLMPGYDRDKHIAETLMLGNERGARVIRTVEYVERECKNLIEQFEALDTK